MAPIHFKQRQLSVIRHDRDAVGMTYVYPVVSRRAGGVSVGVNLNPNNACNWRCVYCQVPNLIAGKGPPIDLELLRRELSEMLEAIVDGDFLEQAAPEGARSLCDIALSGNGEPTSSPQFAECVATVGKALSEFKLQGTIPVTLITNGSLLGKASVRRALAALASLGGRVWFKLDGGSDRGLLDTNHCHVGIARHLEQLRTSASICPTWIQSCFFSRARVGPTDEERRAYLHRLTSLVREQVPIRGVLLYTLARPSLRESGGDLSAVSESWLRALACEVRALGIEVTVSV